MRRRQTYLPGLKAEIDSRNAPSEELDGCLWALIDPRPLEDCGSGQFGKRDPLDAIAFDVPPRFTRSLDEAVRLVEECLPTNGVVIAMDPSGCGCSLTWWPGALNEDSHTVRYAHESGPLAIVGALVTLLIQFPGAVPKLGAA